MPRGLVLRHRLLAPAAAWAAGRGAPIHATTASPRASIVHLAGGQQSMVAGARCVVSVHDSASLEGDAAAPTRLRRLLHRSVSEGAILHATTSRIADALVDLVDIGRGAVIVAAPGVVEEQSAELPTRPRPLVTVPSATPAGARLAAALRETNSVDVLVTAGRGPLGDCVADPSRDERFPTHLLAALASGVPVVAARTWTTTAVLGGAVRLVEPASPAELVEAALDLAANASARAIAIAAGRARAQDYSCEARAVDLFRLYEHASRQ